MFQVSHARKKKLKKGKFLRCSELWTERVLSIRTKWQIWIEIAWTYILDIFLFHSLILFPCILQSAKCGAHSCIWRNWMCCQFHSIRFVFQYIMWQMSINSVLMFYMKRRCICSDQIFHFEFVTLILFIIYQHWLFNQTQRYIRTKLKKDRKGKSRIKYVRIETVNVQLIFNNHEIGFRCLSIFFHFLAKKVLPTSIHIFQPSILILRSLT